MEHIKKILEIADELMTIQQDSEEMYRNRGEKDMEDYSHAKYMGMFDLTFAIREYLQEHKNDD